MSVTTRRFVLALLILVTLVADQITKHIVRISLVQGGPRHYGVLTLVYAENRGAFMSLGATLPAPLRAAIFNGIVTVGLMFATVVVFRGRLKRGDDVALALVVAGGIGNLIDRIRFDGRVTDFLYLSAGPLHTGVFNVADVAITLGVIWLLVSWCLPFRRVDSSS
jgi:signal peptidase II